MANARRRARSHVNIPICLAGVLFCLTLFSFHLSSGVIARYSATSQGSDSARVISFGDLTLTEDPSAVDTQFVYPGAKLNWNATVSFTGSESATYVFLAVTPDEGCTVSGDGMTYSLKGLNTEWTVDGWNYLDGTSSPYVYYIPLNPNVPLSEKKFFSDTTYQVSENLNADDIDKVKSSSAKFKAYVVQSNGFDSPQAAWTSLEAKH